MLGNFTYCNPTKLYFGENSISFLPEELNKYGKNIMLCYGNGSIKKSGIYNQIISILQKCGKNVIDDGGVMPNPTLEKLYDGANKAKNNGVDFILAVGGGSVCDYAKAVSVSAFCESDPWKKYYIDFEEPTCKIIPVGCVLTMVGTGSEMNAGAVITNTTEKLKIGHVFGENVFPKFAVLNPVFTYTLPKYQMVAGIYDIFNHICEQYFSGEDNNTTDYIAEGLMNSLIHSSKIAEQNPTDYEARSNIMWTATWALNTLLKKGKTGDWNVHMIGQSVGAHTNATHGMTLSAVSTAYYRYICPYGLKKFARFAKNVWKITQTDKSDEQLASEGLAAMESWMKELGLVMKISELGVTEDMISDIANGAFVTNGGYKLLNKNDVINILQKSM